MEMLTVVDIEYIRRKFYVEGWSIRKIAKQLAVSRPTVRKALKSAEPWRYTLQHAKPSPVMDPYREIILGWLRTDRQAPAKQRHTAKRIYVLRRSLYGRFRRKMAGRMQPYASTPANRWRV
jgi:transposase